MPKTYSTPDDVLKALVAAHNADLEALLYQRAWFGHRRTDWVVRTIDFVKAYDVVRTAMMPYWSLGNDRATAAMRFRGSSLNLQDRLAPWAAPSGDEFIVSPKWKHWVAGRQSADKRGMIYEDFVAGAGLAARLRGWPRFPTPNQLCAAKIIEPGVDGYTDATITAYCAKKYSKVMRLVPATHDGLSVAAFTGNDQQMEYFRYVASEVVRVNPGLAGMRNLKAERVWAGLIAGGTVPACLSLDSLLQVQSSLTSVA